MGTGAGRRSNPDRAHPNWARAATLAIAGALSLFLLYGWNNLWPLVLPPLLVGAAIGLSSRERRGALVAGFLAGGLGALVSTLLYYPPRLISELGSVPGWMLANVAPSTFSSLMVSIRNVSMPLSLFVAHESLVPFVLCAVGLTSAAAIGAQALQRLETGRLLARVLAWCVTGLLVACFLSTSIGVDGPWFTFLDGPLTPGSYSNDMEMNLRTVELMAQNGNAYYPSTVQALSEKQGAADSVVDGQIKWGSAALIRMPTMFYLLRLVTILGPGRLIGWLSLALAAGLFLLLFNALSTAVGYRALFVVFALFPCLILLCQYKNALLPEWWAAVCVLCSFAFLVRRWILAALVVGAFGVLLRETTGVWLLSGALVFGVLGLSADRRWWRWSGVAVAVLLACGAAFALHVSIGSHYIVQTGSGGILSYVGDRAARDLDLRFGAPVAFLMLPYGLNTFSPLWLLPLSVAGLWVGLVRAPVGRLVSVAYVTLFAVFFATIGATNSYWGQIVTPFIVIGAALLVVSMDRLASPASWLLKPADAALPDWPAVLAKPTRAQRDAEPAGPVRR